MRFKNGVAIDTNSSNADLVNPNIVINAWLLPETYNSSHCDDCGSINMSQGILRSRILMCAMYSNIF
jgi:hypothetical protein